LVEISNKAKNEMNKNFLANDIMIESFGKSVNEIIKLKITGE